MSTNACLEKLIKFLHEKGLSENQGLYENHCLDKQFFGNEIYLFEADNMLIRVVSDRGIWDIEVSSIFGRSNEFHEFSYIVSYLEGRESYTKIPISEEAAYFIANYNRISTLFNRKNYKNTIKALQAMRLEYLKTQPWYNAISQNNVTGKLQN